MVDAVATAAKLDRAELLQSALHALQTKHLDALDLPAADKDAVRAQCAQLQRGRSRLYSRWDSMLFDLLPCALVDVVGCPLHIFGVGASNGEIVCNVVRPSDAASPLQRLQPKKRQQDKAIAHIALVRSDDELDAAHYDLIVQHPMRGACLMTK
eukprot:m.429 g.429  ORF g.429 m.429 type:complete len:154 (+) comp206_c1_seq1:527-988(+)